MTETTIQNVSIPHAATSGMGQAVRKSNRGLFWYSVLLAVTVVGWIARDNDLVDPANGVGYWLGIIGGSLMLVLVFYPAGKKSALMHRLGLTKHWFRIHLIFGLLGPLLILYHCNFKVGAINSKFALYSMLAVAGSGIVGKHFYARIHRSLFGKRSSMGELRAELSKALENSSGLAAVLPNFIEELRRLSDELQGDRITKSIGFGSSLLWSVKHYYIRIRLYRLIRRETNARATESEVLARNAKSLRRTANTYARRYVGLLRRVAQFSFYERLFSLWHVFHLPLFFLLIITASIHVLAVHMY